jgi:hypothetical protein
VQGGEHRLSVARDRDRDNDEIDLVATRQLLRAAARELNAIFLTRGPGGFSAAGIEPRSS